MKKAAKSGWTFSGIYRLKNDGLSRHLPKMLKILSNSHLAFEEFIFLNFKTPYKLSQYPDRYTFDSQFIYHYKALNLDPKAWIFGRYIG